MSVSNINERDADGWTNLCRVVQKGDVTTVAGLLKAGADVNVMTLAGDTPLHIASQLAYLEIVRLLLDNGADVNAEDDIGWTSLHYASRNGHASVVELLAFKGADIHKRIGFGETPFGLAARSEEVKRVLLAFGADMEIRVSNYQTPLMLSVASISVEEAQFLLDFKPDTTKSNQRFWDISETNKEKMKQLLLEYSKKSEKEREQTRSEILNGIRNEVGIRLMKYAQQDIVGICIAFSSLDLPPYVLLWITDWLPHYNLLSHLKKIRLIESCRNSICKIEKIKLNYLRCSKHTFDNE